ncbi:MAG: oxidoreductase family protein [Microgenomates group bacterium Gr01-1014_7]|nr:MAG: oxidoreductase family protein [Microgenomates group bacterium Gr01-1014_7]
MIKKIRPLVIGIGVAGRRHLEAQLNLGIKTGIYTTNPQTAKSLRAQNNIIVFDNFEDGLDWSNLVHVCTPDDKHTEFVAKALKKRKVVLCEKSFTTNLSDALYLQKLAHQYDVVIIVGQNYRLTPTFAETRKRVLEGQLGTITQIETTYFHDRNDYQRRYSDRNFLYIGGSHALDLACWIAGEQVVSIKASSENKLNYQIIVKFSSGLKGDIKLDASSPRSISGTDLIVYGEKGKLVSHNKLDKLLFYKKGAKLPQSILLPNTKTFTIPQEVKIVDDYLLGKVTSHWPLPAVDEAVNLIKVLDAIKKAISSGKSEKV